VKFSKNSVKFSRLLGPH